MKASDVQVDKMTSDSFRGYFKGVTINIDRLSFHSGSTNSEWRVVLKGPVRLSEKVKALYFATGFGAPKTHISEAIEFAKTKVAL